MGGTGSVQKPSSAPGVPVAIATELNFHEQSESKSEQAAPVIRFIDFNNFAKLGSFPRYPDNADIVTALDDIDRSNAFMVFISHCWLRGWSGAEGWDGRPHPDNASHDKYQLTVDGIRKVWKVIAPNMEKCFIWLDFGCINQDGDPGGELSQLDRIVGCTDCLFTPIHDPEDIESLTPGVSNVYENYKSKWWRGDQYAYLSRGWCRIEMFYAANIPLNGDLKTAVKTIAETGAAVINGDSSGNENKLCNESGLAIELSNERISKFAKGLKYHASMGRRPHLLYGTKERMRQYSPLILPPLQNAYFEAYHPEKGSITKESDRVNIARLVKDLLPAMTTVRAGYTGDRDATGKMHGKGRLVYENGDIYDGEFVAGKRHGYGEMHFANGDNYYGQWAVDTRHGRGLCEYASGEVFDGIRFHEKIERTIKFQTAEGEVHEVGRCHSRELH